MTEQLNKTQYITWYDITIYQYDDVQKRFVVLQLGHERAGLAVLPVRPPIVPRCLITGPLQPPGPRCTSNHHHHYCHHSRATTLICHHRTRSARGAASSERRAAATGAVGKGTAGTAVGRRRRCPQPDARGVLAVGTSRHYQEDHHHHQQQQQCQTIRRLCQRKNAVCSVLSPGNRWRPLRLGLPRNMQSRRNWRRRGRRVR